MPEGDTIHTVARVMAPDLVGKELVALVVDKRALALAAGARVTACEAVGKHLLVHMTPRAEAGAAALPHILRVHLGMKGSWHRYRPGEAWRRPAVRARVELATDKWVFVCFDAKEVDVVARNAPRPDVVAHLGPDLLGASFDVAAVVARARHPGSAGVAVGDLLLAQTIAAGIGNIYKNETLFLERLHPWTPVAAIDDAALAALYERARGLMRDNLEAGGGRITTTRPPDGNHAPTSARYWVYRRGGMPCRVCGATIRSRLQGPTARRTWWCPRCQPASSGVRDDTKGA